MAPTPETLPKYTDLLLPTLRAVDALGGSGSAREITERLLGQLDPSEAELTLAYENRPKSILIDRIDWARSYCKLGGALDSPRRGVFLMSPLGREILKLSDADADARVRALDRQVRAARKPKPDQGSPAESGIEDDERGGALDDQILARLHRLTPDAFEEFCLYLLRQFGMELARVGGSGDEGIDGIGTAPLGQVLSATVAVQAKRWDPTTAVGREKVALFQRDAAAAGAERAVLITLGRFTEPARKASRQATPTVDLIDGARICELVRELRLGIAESVDEAWYERFEAST